MTGRKVNGRRQSAKAELRKRQPSIARGDRKRKRGLCTIDTKEHLVPTEEMYQWFLNPFQGRKCPSMSAQQVREIRRFISETPTVFIPIPPPKVDKLTELSNENGSFAGPSHGFIPILPPKVDKLTDRAQER